jgi:hypothetical protein
VITARTNHNMLGDLLNVYIVQEVDRRTIAVLQPREGGGFQWQQLPDDYSARSDDYVPTYTVPMEVAQVLMSALAVTFHGTLDPVLTRKDLEKERTRVDTLASALIDVAKELASQ